MVLNVRNPEKQKMNNDLITLKASGVYSMF